MTKKREFTVYTCGTTWRHEIPDAPDWSECVYETEEECKKHDCWQDCGIVKLKIVVEEIDWVEPETSWEEQIKKLKKEGKLDDKSKV